MHVHVCGRSKIVFRLVLKIVTIKVIDNHCMHEPTKSEKT